MEEWLFEITSTAYVLAKTECAAIRLFKSGAHEKDVIEAVEVRTVEWLWSDASPYGETEGRTCREILAAIRAAEDAATPDPNQLALPIAEAAERS